MALETATLSEMADAMIALSQRAGSEEAAASFAQAAASFAIAAALDRICERLKS
ncbi:MAG TPA: hypothetical protein VL614_15200 [Acetobacteraceae bacterium]|jgi:hypothetical protein|nr:hypothetical protein [Acetobacteraceae bacterium]